MCQLLQKHAVPRPIPFRSSPQLRDDNQNQGDEDMEEVQSVHSSSEDSDMEVQSVHSSSSQFSEDSDVEEDPHVQTSTQAPPSSQFSDPDAENQQVQFDRASHLQDETDLDVEDQPVQSSSQLSDLDMEDQPVQSSDRALQLSIETDQPVQSEMGAQLQNREGLYENEHRDTPLADEEDLVHQSPDNAQPLQGSNDVQSPDDAQSLQHEEDVDQRVTFSPGMKIE